MGKYMSRILCEQIIPTGCIMAEPLMSGDQSDESVSLAHCSATPKVRKNLSLSPRPVVSATDEWERSVVYSRMGEFYPAIKKKVMMVLKRKKKDRRSC